MSKTCDKGEPDDECAACKASIPAKDPIYCSRCVMGNDEEDASAPIGRQCAGCGERTDPPTYCKPCAEARGFSPEKDEAAALEYEFQLCKLGRSHKPTAEQRSAMERIERREIAAIAQATRRGLSRTMKGTTPAPRAYHIIEREKLAATMARVELAARTSSVAAIPKAADGSRFPSPDEIARAFATARGEATPPVPVAAVLGAALETVPIKEPVSATRGVQAPVASAVAALKTAPPSKRSLVATDVACTACGAAQGAPCAPLRGDHPSTKIHNGRFRLVERRNIVASVACSSCTGAKVGVPCRDRSGALIGNGVCRARRTSFKAACAPSTRVESEESYYLTYSVGA